MIVYFKKEDFKNSFKLNIFCYKDNGDKYDLFKDDLWFEFHNIDPDNFDCNANFIACALLMHCMKNGENLNIRGGGDIELLRNLENFQDVYCSWMPSVWKKIKINFDFIKPLIETNKRQKGNRAVMAMSGGMDAAYSFLRHKNKLDIQYPYDIERAFLVQGFDSRVDHMADFEMMKKSVKAMLENEGVNLSIVRTNLRDVRAVPNWRHAHGTGLAACMHVFSDFDIGLIAGDFKYNDFPRIWGSSPMLNHYFSSSNMKITYDGANSSRCEKAKTIEKYSKFKNNLLVCHKGEFGRPCLKCDKCIRTILNFKSNLLTPPPGMDLISDLQGFAIKDEVSFIFFKDIYLTARRNNIEDAWLKNLNSAIKQYKEERACII